MLAQRCYGYRLEKWFELVERVVPWGQVGLALLTISQCGVGHETPNAVH